MTTTSFSLIIRTTLSLLTFGFCMFVSPGSAFGDSDLKQPAETERMPGSNSTTVLFPTHSQTPTTKQEGTGNDPVQENTPPPQTKNRPMSRFAIRFDFQPSILSIPRDDEFGVFAGVFPLSFGPNIYAIDTCSSSRAFCMDWSFQAQVLIIPMVGQTFPTETSQQSKVYRYTLMMLDANPAVYMGGLIGTEAHFFFSRSRFLGWNIGLEFAFAGPVHPGIGTQTHSSEVLTPHVIPSLHLKTGVILNVHRNISVQVGIGSSILISNLFLSIPMSVQYRF